MKPSIDPTKIFESVTLFQKLHPKFLKAIYKACTERQFADGDTLVEQGNSGVGLFIILQGTVRVEKKLANGTIIEIAKNGPGDVIGEMSVLDGASRTASVIAIGPVSCLVLSSWSFKSILETHPEVALGILPVVVQRFRETNTKLIELGSKAQVNIDAEVSTS